MKKRIIRKNNKNDMKMHRREKEFITFMKLRLPIWSEMCKQGSAVEQSFKVHWPISHKGNEMVVAYVLENQEQF